MYFRYSCNIDAVGVMRLLERRFPQATLLAHATESDMITSLKEWRRDYVDQFSNSDDVDTDRIVRFDSCVNGYGMKPCLTLAYTCNILYICVSGN